MDTLPLLPTSTVGSYAAPSWLVAATEAIGRGEFGPRDIQETLDDAVRIALLDQDAAGIDIVTDGEMRRVDFVMGFYDRLHGLRPLPPQRRKGPEGHDMRPRWEITEALAAPEGLGIREEFEHCRSLTTKPIKVTCPGPFTLSGRLAPGTVYPDRTAVAARLAEIINEELRRVAAGECAGAPPGRLPAGAAFIQIDEPSYAVYPDRPREFVELFNRTVEGVPAKIGLHMCFGNYRGRPVGKRTYRPLFPTILEARADQLVLEFANREMAELDLWREFPSDKELGAGVVDVKSYYIETPEDVAARIRACLKVAAPEQLHLLPDCGFSQTARWASFAKLKSLVEGARIVRRELVG
jgi:5-methyltetrahydropteroyltriglutamate--homocysteine methyltransferase